MESAHFTQKDRDLLTTLDVKISRAISDIKDLGVNFASKESVSDLEKRTEKMENDIKWAVRLVIGIVITSLLGLILIK